jgi:hypothetical protein
MNKLPMVIAFITLLISCESTPSSQSFSRWYDPWLDVREYPQLITLKDGEQPKIIESHNIDNDINDYLSENFRIVGRTGFNGTASVQENLINDIRKQCIQNGALIALYKITYTDTRSGISGYGQYISSYNIRRYDYTVYYFVKNTANIDIIGLWLTDLDNEDRQKFQRNTGAIVYVVYKTSPAFYANILKNDIIIRINEDVINDRRDYNYASMFLDSGDEVEIEFIRNSRNQIVKFKL